MNREKVFVKFNQKKLQPLIGLEFCILYDSVFRFSIQYTELSNE